ncbi:3942_t:CDS:1 [Cetraspora pellucida]|uniref:3942_t:CDS:1 n=1 Tax=Cetraspora pellucida TaxID=1433469 RepID=A0ACA9L626_9GLOM|nr:3942_t:CDS:1 [Cetraspora pellucida]
MFKELIESILVNISIKKIDNKIQIQINNSVKDCEVDEFNKFHVIFDDWAIKRTTEHNLNDYYYKHLFNIIVKILVSKSVYYFRIRTYIYYYHYSKQFICNLNTNVSYMIEDSLKFDSDLRKIRDELYKHNTLDTEIAFILTEEFKIQSDNLVKFTSLE